MDAIFLLEPSYNGADYVATAHALGLRPVVIRRANGPENPAPDLSDEIIADTADDDAVEKSCSSWIKSHRPKKIGVLAGYELAVPAAAVLCQRLGVSGNSPASARAARDKWLMRRALLDSRVLCPKSRRFDDVSAACESVRENDYPVVVKPVDMACSLFVKLIKSPGELETHARRILRENKNFDRSTRARKQLLIERFARGPEFSIELLLEAGDAIFSSVTEKQKAPLPHFVEIGHVVPSSVTDPAQNGLLVETAVRATKALGLTSGPCHVELILTKRGPVVIELAARLGGDQITRLVRLAQGVDLHRAAVRQAMGKRVTRQELRPRGDGAAIRFLHPSINAGSPEPGGGDVSAAAKMFAKGRCFRIDGDAEARQVRHVHEVVIYPAFPKDGALIKRLTSSLDRVGHIISLAPNSREAGESVMQAVAAIRFRPI